MRRAAALLTAAALLLAACGSDGGSTDTSEPNDAPDADVTTTVAGSPGIGATAQSGNLVTVHYTGTLLDGSEFGTSVGGEPLQFTIDTGQMIQGFNDAVIGMAPGETKTITLPPEEAYQDYQDDLVIEVTLDQVPEGTEAGDQLMSPAGQVVTVVEVTDEFAVVDTNHPLAGETLVFEITLVSIDA
ncbi:MAG: FKBP-type peptidyl-prolyl cis-trans isomerase [Actinobacteria bacterium]|nr:FKBP-type peptidyl-prolyl cis-trans isomerase [Actinomycetota bacterium]